MNCKLMKASNAAIPIEIHPLISAFLDFLYARSAQVSADLEIFLESVASLFADSARCLEESADFLAESAIAFTDC